MESHQGKKYSDSKSTGLVLRIGKTGLTWVHRFKSKDWGDRLISIGDYPTMNVATARSLVQARRDDFVSGVDPDKIVEECEGPRGPTFEDVFDQWFQGDVVSQHRDEGDYILGLLTPNALNDLGKMPIREIKRADVMACIDRIKAKGSRTTAKKNLQLIKRILHYAQIREIVQGNVASIVRSEDFGLSKDEREGRALYAEEVSLLAQRLATSGMVPNNQNLIWFLFSTGIRVGSASKAAWTDINLPQRVLLVQDEKKRKQHAYSIHISDFCAQILMDIRAHHEKMGVNSRYLFYSRNDPSEPLDDKTLQKQIRQRQIGVKTVKGVVTPVPGRINDQSLVLTSGYWRVHDLRRTASSMWQGMGVPSEVRRACMNHKPQDKNEKTYDRFNLPWNIRVDAFDRLGNRLSELKSMGEAALPPTVRT